MPLLIVLVICVLSVGFLAWVMRRRDSAVDPLDYRAHLDAESFRQRLWQRRPRRHRGQQLAGVPVTGSLPSAGSALRDDVRPATTALGGNSCDANASRIPDS